MFAAQVIETDAVSDEMDALKNLTVSPGVQNQHQQASLLRRLFSDTSAPSAPIPQC